jgi:acyl-CoA thioesterase FadM
MVNLRPSLIAFGYEAIRQSDGALLAEGESTHIVVGRGKKKVQLPEKYLEPFRRAIGSEARTTL